MRAALSMLAAAAVLASASAHVCRSQATCAADVVSAVAGMQPERPLTPTQSVIAGVGQALLTPLLEAAPAQAFADGGGNDIDKTWCPNSTYWDLLPVELATLNPRKPVTWSSQCFGSVTASAYAAGSHLNVTISGSSPANLLCSDVLLVISSYRVVGAVLPSALKPTASLSFDMVNLEAKDLEAGGFKVLLMPCGLLGSVDSLLATVSLFIGDDEAFYKRSMDFLTQRGVWPDAVPFNKTVYLTPSRALLPSGTQLAIGRLDGLDPTIMWLTGGLTGHVAVAVWEGDQLYVVESTAPNPLGKVYWPCANGYCGIMRTKWEEWNTLGKAAAYHVGVMPLADPYASAFDEGAFWTWFATVEGTPYGYASMMYVFTDTSPNANWPAPVTNSILNMIGYLFDDLTPSTNSTTPGGGVDAYDYLIRAFNHRAGTACKDWTCVTDWSIMHNTTYVDVAQQVEQDSWRYFGPSPTEGNVSMVCSVFAAAVYSHALPESVLPAYQSEEQTPKDNYQMALWNATHFTPENCPGGYFNSPSGAYCQIMGQWELPLGKNAFNTIHPYAGMNNHCPAQWTPNPAERYIRCPPGNPSCC